MLTTETEGKNGKEKKALFINNKGFDYFCYAFINEHFPLIKHFGRPGYNKITYNKEK